jgi:hypothetical protein
MDDFISVSFLTIKQADKALKILVLYYPTNFIFALISAINR